MTWAPPNEDENNKDDMLAICYQYVIFLFNLLQYYFKQCTHGGPFITKNLYLYLFISGFLSKLEVSP